MKKTMTTSGGKQQRKSNTASAGLAAAIGRRRAFTLVELLIVIALSALLLALLFGPIVQGFKLTNRARAQAAAQDATRFGIEQLSRELRQASYVFDNTNSPIALPLEAPDVVGGTTHAAGSVTRKNTYATDNSGNAIVIPEEAYGRIDFIPSAIRSDTASGTGAAGALDPTTGLPLNGGQLRMTIAPGTRYTRYWVGLRRNYTKSGATVSKAYYDNVYEFPRTDNDLNSFVLWRADYDPTDPNLVAQVKDTTTGQIEPDVTSTFDGGGVNDPDFFYNLKTANTTNGAGSATGNGRTYAENWRSIATAVVAGTNVDLLSWRRNSHKDIETTSPVQIGMTFTPSAIVGDNATPGFVSAAAAEDPSAVPSLYTTQYGQWTMPFTITVYRSSTHYGGGTDSRGLFGSVSLYFHVNTAGDIAVDISDSSGTLAVNGNTKYYWMKSVSTGKYFVTMPSLTVMVDPSRGKVETGIPPIASTNQVIPYFYDASNATPNSIQQMNASTLNNSVANLGEVVEMAFYESTLHPQAGQQAGTQYVPKNQGILFADLASLNTESVNANGTMDRGNYYALTDTTHTTPYISPFVTFGGANSPTGVRNDYHGGRVVSGSERVSGPDNQVFEVNTTAGTTTTTDPNLDPTAVTANTVLTGDVAYTRVPSATESLAKEANIVTTLSTGVEGIFTRRGAVTYKLIQDLKDFNRPYLLFDDAGGKLIDPRVQDNSDGTPPGMSAANLAALGPNDAGLPAGFVTDTTAAHDRKVKVTFLWQNNYARTSEGRPVDANGQTEITQLTSATTTTVSAIQPEPDAFKVDYATRSLINVGLAVRVYDSSTGQPETSQVTDKIRVSNVSR